MYCFLFFVLLMGVEGHSVNGSGTMEASTPKEYNTQSPTSSTPSSTEEAETATPNLPKHTPGSKPTSRSLLPDSTTLPRACPKNSLCVADILQPLPLIVIGALGITCFTLLVITLVLACNTCCLKRKVSSSYQVCSETAQPAAQPTTRCESGNCEQSETHLMMNEMSNGKPEGDEIQEEPKEPEKPEEVAKEAHKAEVPNQATTEDSTQNEMPTTESPPDQDLPPLMEDMEDIVISE